MVNEKRSKWRGVTGFSTVLIPSHRCSHVVVVFRALMTNSKGFNHILMGWYSHRWVSRSTDLIDQDTISGSCNKQVVRYILYHHAIHQMHVVNRLRRRYGMSKMTVLFTRHTWSMGWACDTACFRRQRDSPCLILDYHERGTLVDGLSLRYSTWMKTVLFTRSHLPCRMFSIIMLCTRFIQPFGHAYVTACLRRQHLKGVRSRSFTEAFWHFSTI